MSDVRWSPDTPPQRVRLIGWFTDLEDGSRHAVIRRGNSERWMLREADWDHLAAVEAKDKGGTPG